MLAVETAYGSKHLIVDKFYLSNEMMVIVIPNDKIPAVHHSIWYYIGAADDPYGKSGTAHFLEHLMFKATKNVKSGEFTKLVEASGGEMNAFTSANYTGYYEKVPSDKLELVMKLEADRMRNLIFNEEEFQKEKLVVIEERRQRTDNNPQALLGEQLNAALYLNNTYGIPTIGWQHEIESITREDVMAFYSKYYRPDNAVLIVEGDVKTEELKILAEKYYGVYAGGKDADRNRKKEPPHIAERRVILRHQNVRQEKLVRKYLAPSQTSEKNSEFSYPLMVLAQLLAGGDTSFLYQELVINQKVATSVDISYNNISIGISNFGFYLTPMEGVTLEYLEKAFDESLEKFFITEIQQYDLNRAKNLMQSEAIYAREGLGSIARIYGVAITCGVGMDYFPNWKKNIEKVTAEQIIQAGKFVFQKKKSTTGFLLGN